jgi:hypothetical protein
MAYDNLTLQTSVVQAMQAANLYLPSGTLPEETLTIIAPDGKSRDYNMGRIDYADLKTFADELDIALHLQNPIVQSLYAKNAKQLANLIRVVQYTTRSGFKGSCGSGNALDALLFRAEQFSNPDIVAATFRTTWLRAIGAIGTLQMICANDGGAIGAKGALTMANNEAIAILGFANPASDPCTSGLQFTYLGTPYNVQNLGFDLSNLVYGDPIKELKQPLLVYPGETILLNNYYYKAGMDEVRPIGLWIKMATNIRALATA